MRLSTSLPPLMLQGRYHLRYIIHFTSALSSNAERHKLPCESPVLVLRSRYTQLRLPFEPTRLVISHQRCLFCAESDLACLLNIPFVSLSDETRTTPFAVV